MIKTLIFDFDGTLADCKELHQNAFREAVQKIFPSAEYDDELVEGRPTREKIRILHSMGYSFNGDKLNEIKQSLTQENLPQYIEFNPALYEQMERLSHSYKICLASNATEVFLHRSLEIMRIMDQVQLLSLRTVQLEYSAPVQQEHMLLMWKMYGIL
jgi:beta-phosphoglucomutase-like phosphatase (HAD superfamily)